ncbi:dual oxidase maturation factor 1 [Cephus cinctus]|uniref:Dual oxidase maturation factor 1 n=1 Tax=Cephus cinctus TaxID=211228 RepID=A0AAJ7C5N3_CEPCN|nr:dual oxidase maturation factor 1 [Cephus cinctus]
MLKKGYFDFGRSEGFPTQYPENKTAVTVDVLETGFMLAFVIIATAYYIITPGYSQKRSIYVVLKATFSILIGCLIMLGNFGQEWEVGYLNSTTPYRAGEKSEIRAIMGIKIGLRSVNITLKGMGERNTPLEKEQINYNERFAWTWDQGRIGFGPYAGLVQRTFRESQRKGLPLPILWIAEYFTLDGEGIRFGRFYRTAGWYTHILLWLALPTWIMANIFLQLVGRYAAYFIGITGSLQLLSCSVWFLVRNPLPLRIPFADGVIQLHYGPDFWLTCSSGTLCLILALVMIFMDLRYPDALSAFLGIDPLNQYDECIIKQSDLNNATQKTHKMDNVLEMEEASKTETIKQIKDANVVVMKRRSTLTKAQKKTLLRAPLPVRIEQYPNEDPIYANQVLPGPSQAYNERYRSTEKLVSPPLPQKPLKKKNRK